ncbi:MAG TPA: GNAT family N-acetyltransferase [Jatrophihabitans sp.]|jgi:RimJ/RimL family protein N-acetyltransferase
MIAFAELSTARLRLSAVSMADLEEFHALHSDADLYRHAPEARHPDIAHSESQLGGYLEDWARWNLGYWSVRLLNSDQYIGCAGVRRNEVNWNVYYRFAKTAWGNGYATETIQAAGPCAESIEAGAVLQAVMRPANPASRAVVERLGMTYCGTELDYAGTEQLVYQLPAADLH